MRKTAAAVVVGSGVAGTAAAFFLAKKGVRDVLLLEKQSVAAGATGNTSGLVRCHYTNPHSAALAMKGREIFRHWKDLIGGEPGFKETGFLQIVGHHDVENLKANVAMLRRIGLNTHILGPEEAKDLFPLFWVDDIGAAAYEPESGYADGYLTATSLAWAARDLGVEVRQGVTALRIRTEKGRATGVETSDGPLEAPVVVLAAGAWTKPLAQTAGVDLPLGATRVVAGILGVPEGVPQPQITYIDRALGSNLHPEGQRQISVSIGGPRPYTPYPVDPNHVDLSVDPSWQALSAQRIVKRIPALAEASWQRTFGGPTASTPDQAAIIDRLPGVEGLFFMVGGFGGFKIGPAMGLAMAELVLEGKATSVDIHPFRLSRFQERDTLKPLREYTIPEMTAGEHAPPGPG